MVRNQPLKRVFEAKKSLAALNGGSSGRWADFLECPANPCSLTHPLTSPHLNSSCTNLVQIPSAASSELLISATPRSLFFPTQSLVHPAFAWSTWGPGWCWNPQLLLLKSILSPLPHVWFFLCCKGWISKQTLRSLACPTAFLTRASKCFRQEDLNINAPRKTRNLNHCCWSVHDFQRSCSSSDKACVCFCSAVIQVYLCASLRLWESVFVAVMSKDGREDPME